MNTLVQLTQALAWPLTALAIAALLLSSSGQELMGRLLGRVKKVSAFGVDLELDLTPQAATRVRADLETTFRGYKVAIKSEFDRQANILHIADLRRRVLESAVTPHLRAGAATPSYRSTVHVRDILLHEAMNQLLDYLPAASTAGGAGRTFSMRFGIVGEAWRTGRSRQKDLVEPGDEYVIDHWGMLPEEAASAGYGKRSFAAAVLNHGELTVGVFYLDSPEAEAFGPGLLGAIEEAASSTGLNAALAELETKMSERGPAFTIFDA